MRARIWLPAVEHSRVRYFAPPPGAMTKGVVVSIKTISRSANSGHVCLWNIHKPRLIRCLRALTRLVENLFIFDENFLDRNIVNLV